MRKKPNLWPKIVQYLYKMNHKPDILTLLELLTLSEMSSEQYIEGNKLIFYCQFQCNVFQCGFDFSQSSLKLLEKTL